MSLLLSALLPLLAPQQPQPAAPTPLRVLVITGGGFHDFEGNTNLLLAGLQPLLQLEVTRLRLTPDGERPPKGEEQPPSRFLNGEMSRRYDAVLQYTQGEVLGTAQADRDSLLHFVRGGGGFVGIHCAADTFKWSRDYIAMLGGRFQSHPPFGPYKARRLLGDHPVLEGIADLDVNDEFYYLDACRLDDKSVLLSGEGPTDGKERPLAWSKRYGEGRVVCTVLGHGPETHGMPAFHKLIANALRWVAETPPWSKDKDGWRTLFDGQSLAGWTQCGQGKFSLQGGELVAEGGTGLLWFSELGFRDFELVCEWKVGAAADDSGVLVRCAPPRLPEDAAESGYEVQILDSGQGAAATGAILGVQGPERKASKPAGAWNEYRLRVTGQRYEVTLNRTLVVARFDGTRALSGHVGLQNHANGQGVRFRNVRVREL